jgi:hypothetical protein
MSVMGQKRKLASEICNVRFTPESGHSLLHGVHKVRASAKQVADVICGYPEIICGAMIARQIFDKLLALPTAITCDTDPADNPAENSTTKRKRLACIEFCGRLSLRIARHVNSQVDPERSFFAWPSCRQPIIARRCTVTLLRLSVAERPVKCTPGKELHGCPNWRTLCSPKRNRKYEGCSPY